MPDITDPIQVIEFIDFGVNAPPIFSASVLGSQLYYSNSTPAHSIQPVAIPLVAGNYYGVLGCGNATVGSSTSQNPYSTQTGSFTSDVLGVPTDIFRLLTQTPIGANGGNQLCSAEFGGTISRVEVYLASSGGGTIATNTVLGAGCGGNAIGDGSAYQLFTAAAAFDLSGTGHTYIWTGNGYVLLDGAGTIVPPTGTPVPFTDNNTQAVVLPFSFSCTQGLINTVWLCSNGWLSFESTTATDQSETVAELLSQFSRLAFLWDDLNPANGGTIHTGLVGPDFHITFTAVPEWSATGANTVQVVIKPTGDIEVRYGTCSLQDALVGLSSGNGATDPGPTDYSNLAATGPIMFTTGFGPFLPDLGLSASTRPVLGTSWNLTVDNIQPTGVFGVTIYGTVDPNIPDLAFLGLPGCQLRTSLDFLATWIPSGTSYSYSAPVPAMPASLIGFALHTQAAVFGGNPNPFDAVTSNGVQGMLGDL